MGQFKLTIKSNTPQGSYSLLAISLGIFIVWHEIGFYLSLPMSIFDLQARAHKTVANNAIVVLRPLQRIAADIVNISFRGKLHPVLAIQDTFSRWLLSTCSVDLVAQSFCHLLCINLLCLHLFAYIYCACACIICSACQPARGVKLEYTKTSTRTTRVFFVYSHILVVSANY